jgi:hypothetical protein
MPSTVRDLSELTTVDNADMLLISDTSDVVNRDKRISRLNLVGTNISGGGSISMSSKNITIPADGTVVMRSSTAPVALQAVRWLDNNRIEDAGIAFDQMVRRTGSATTLNYVAQWHDDNTIKGTPIHINDVALLGTAQTYTALPTFSAGLRFAAGQTTLTHYQTGTFTPALTFGGSANGLTYNATNGQTGRYIRIGTLVNVWASIRLSAVGSSVGNAVVGGLPFASVNLTNHRPPITTAYASMSFTGALQGVNVNNTTDITLQIGNNGVNAPATNANFTNTSFIYINFAYECA